MSLEFVERLIKDDWRATATGVTLSDQVSCLSQEELGELVELYFGCVEVTIPREINIPEIARTLKQKGRFLKPNVFVTYSLLASFLHAVMLAEYRLDDLLLHSSDIRMAEFDHYAAGAGFEPEVLRRIYLNWHSTFRKQVLRAVV